MQLPIFIRAGVASLFITSLFTVLPGCATKDIEQQWSANIGKLGVVPVYPPRENIYVGQVYLRTEGPEGLTDEKSISAVNQNVLFATLGLKLADQYAANPGSIGILDSDEIPWPKQSAFQTSATRMAMWDQPQPDDADLKRQPRRLLKLVGFPAFTLASGTVASLGLDAPTGAFGSRLGAAYSDNISISVSVPAAESYSYPLMKQLTALAALCVKDKWLDHRDKFANSKALSLTLITEVFYARAIDVDLSFAKAGSLGGAVVPDYFMKLDADREAKEKQIAELLNSPKQSEATAQSNQQQADAIAKELVSIRSQMANAMPQVPGVKDEITHASSTGITLRSAFQYPVAIGYRGAIVKFDMEGCKVAMVQNPTIGLGTLNKIQNK